LPTASLYSFPHYIEDTKFGVSCDAFANFKEILTRHKSMVAEYLEKNYDRFFAMYGALIASTNYVTKRQSLKLLGEILLDRANFNVMTRYIANETNLKIIMNLLKDKSKNIQFEAFHVFKASFIYRRLCEPHLTVLMKGFRCQPKEAAPGGSDSSPQQGEAAFVPQELP
jgi:calcium binding protein 39